MTVPGRVAGLRRAVVLGVRARGLEVLAEETFDSGDGNQPLPPRCLDRVHDLDEVPVDGGDADAERLGGLLARVRQPLGFLVFDDLAQLARRSPVGLRPVLVFSPLPSAATFPTGHALTVIGESDST